MLLLPRLFIDCLASRANEHESHLHRAAHVNLRRSVKNREQRAAAEITHLLKVHVLNAALAGGAPSLGARECGIFTCVLENLKATTLALVLMKAAAPNGWVARGYAFAAVTDKLQALKERVRAIC
jgi:hypothetical protein